VEVALGDAWRWADVGMVVAAQLWERPWAWCPVMATVVLRCYGDGGRFRQPNDALGEIPTF
jgi:hypothetical protein